LIKSIPKCGVEYAFLDKQKSKQTCMERYGVDHPNKRNESKRNNSKHKREYFGCMTFEEKKEHGKKSLRGRDLTKVKEGILKSLNTKRSWSEEYKAQLQSRRKEKWHKSVKQRDPEKKKEIYQKYKYASTKLRKQYFLQITYLDTNVTKTIFFKRFIT
jgi:hypothetical protein